MLSVGVLNLANPSIVAPQSTEWLGSLFSHRPLSFVETQDQQVQYKQFRLPHHDYSVCAFVLFVLCFSVLKRTECQVLLCVVTFRI
jgi:hypothetical protein